MSIQDYLANEQFAYITRENTYDIPGAKPGDLYHRFTNEDTWQLIGNLDGSQGLISHDQKVIYDRNKDQWLEIVTGPHCNTCTCYGNA